MSEKEYKIKCENLFAKNTILLNQQKIDAEQILSLQKQNGELTDKVNELEQQIEKMKQCGNCGNGTIGNCEHCKRKPKQKSTDTADYWRLKEIKENG